MQPVADVQQKDAAFHIETTGISHIHESKRRGRPRDLLFVWFAATMTYTSFVIGQLFTSLGLNVWEATVVAILCSLSFLGVGWVAATGPKGGTVTLTISRAAFGMRANRIPSFFSWISAVGWEAVTTTLTVLAILSLFHYMGLPSTGPGITVIALIITLILTYFVPILGHATVISVQKWLAVLLGIFGVILVISILPRVDWAFNPPVKDMAATGVFPTFLLALSIGLITTMYGWTNFAADYSRYLPQATSARKVVGWTLFGGGVSTFVAMMIGVLLGTFVNPQAYAQNPVLAIAKSVPAWAAVPFLLVVVIGDITANYLNAYSSGMSFLSMGVKIARQWAVVLDGSICTLITLYALFISQGFVGFFQSFLGLNIIVIGPWTTVYLAYHWQNRGNYDTNGLYDSSAAGPYWYRGGWNVRVMVAYVVGIVGTFFCVNVYGMWVSPLTTQWFGGADLSAYAAIIITGIVYLLLVRRGVGIEQPGRHLAGAK